MLGIQQVQVINFGSKIRASICQTEAINILELSAQAHQVLQELYTETKLFIRIQTVNIITQPLFIIRHRTHKSGVLIV